MDSYDSHRRIVGLALGKPIHRLHDGLDHAAGGPRIAFRRGHTEARGTPFAMRWVEGFDHSIGVGKDQVAGGELN